MLFRRGLILQVSLTVQKWFLGRLVSALGAVGCAELQGSVSLKKKILLENICEHKLLTENIFP